MARSSTTFPRKWKSAQTTVIRVPELLAEDLLKIARMLDSRSGSYRIREDGTRLILETVPPRKVDYKSDRPVNVASVPQRSPFRYPGGKTWLIPYIRDWLHSRPNPPARLIEPFAGGGIVGLTAGFEGLARHVILSELDPGVGAVWKVILNGEAEWLANRILDFDLTKEKASEVLGKTVRSRKELAFQTILRNRVQRGGIMAPGAGLVKTGENGRGIRSRWYPETLARRIREINQVKGRFTFLAQDAFEVIREYEKDAEACFYIDPPYTVAAKRLYVTWDVDHAALFRAMSRCRGDFLMSYDNTPEVAGMADNFGFETRPIAMKSTHHAKMTELLIGRNLSWLK